MDMEKIPLYKVFMSSTAGEAVNEVLYSGFIGEGEKVEEFEKKLRETLQKKLSISNISRDVRITFPKTHSVYVCEMFIPKSSIPIWVVTKNKDEEFYVRQKKELVRLSPREQKEYIDDNFGDIE